MSEKSAWDYTPSLGMNAILLGLFGGTLLVHTIQGIWFKTWGFLIAVACGCAFEIVGYSGRVLAHSNVDSQDFFLIQICCLTLAPAFFAAGVYLCLTRIVIIFGSNLSRIPAKWYTYIFITCDFISLVLQGAGGGIASVDTQNYRSPQTGTNIMLAGLGFQVATLTLFMALCAEYAIRVIRAPVEARDPAYEKLRGSLKFKLFLVALGVATTAILIRSIYRVIEMAQGWTGELMKDEELFFILEGLMIIVATVILNIFHPGMCFAEGYSITNASEKTRDLEMDSVSVFQDPKTDNSTARLS